MTIQRIALGIYLVVYFFTCFFALYAEHSFIFSLEFPYSLAKGNFIHLYYGNSGKKMVTCDGTFIIPEDPLCSLFNILIAQDVQFVTKGTTVSYFQISSLHKARYFSVSRNLVCEIDSSSLQPNPKASSKIWNIQEIPIKHYPFKVIPHYTLVILMPHDWVDYIEETISLSTSHITKLPTLFVKKNILKEEIKKGLQECACAAVNLNTIHSTNQQHTKYIGLTTIACNKD